MDVKAYTNPSGRLVNTTINLVPYKAFVPNPLPPKLVADWELVNLNSRADRALSELKGVGRNLPNPNLLIKPFMQREAVLSSMIEGTQTEMSDLLAYQLREAPLPGFDEARAPESDNHEVLNYVKAMEYGLETVQKQDIDEGLLLELHLRLLKGVRGEHSNPGHLREEQNFVGPDPDPDNAVYIPPPVPEMRQGVKDLVRYMQKDDAYTPLIRIGLVHSQFETIHPFRDGNGRIGRLLISLLLARWGLMPTPLLYLSAYIEDNKKRYYTLLQEVDQKSNWKGWLEFFLTGVETQAKDAMQRGKRLLDLREEWRQMLNSRKVSKTAERLCDLLFETPIITIPEAQKRMGYKDYKSAQNAVNELLKEGLLVPSSPGDYDKSYKAREILEIVS